MSAGQWGGIPGMPPAGVPGMPPAGVPGVLSTCQACGRSAETRTAVFMQNIGLLVIRFPRTVNGNLCRFCVEKYFWRYTAVSMLLGWWGVISFFTTLVAIPLNVVNYVRCIGLRSPPDDAASLADRRSRGLAGMGCGVVVGALAALGIGLLAIVVMSPDAGSDSTDAIVGMVVVGALLGLPALIAFGLGLRSFLKGRARA